jgi:hypothetical protein
MANLRQISQLLFRRQPAGIEPQEYARELLECRKLPIVDIRSLVLLESVHKEPAIAEIGCDDDSRASALAPSRRGNPLFEHMPAQIRINQTAGDLCDRITQMPVRKRRFAEPAAERLRLEDSTSEPYCTTR